MSFEYDVMTAVREAVQRGGGRSDYESYGRPSRRGRSLGIPLPRLAEQGAHLALVVRLSDEAAEELVEQAREGIAQVLGEHPVQSIGVIGPEEWANWAMQAWHTRRYPSQQVQHVEVGLGGELAAVDDLETEPSAIVLITDRSATSANTPEANDLVLIAIPSQTAGGLVDRVGESPDGAIDIIRPNEAELG